MKKPNKTPLAALMGTAVASTFAATAAHAETNPFGMTELSSGYMQLAETAKEGSCGEGKCGASMNMGAGKVHEGNCAGKKTPSKTAKAKEGACGEGKCGAMMENGKMKKGMEGACGEMMKSKEGACGEKVGKDQAAGK
ncbi:MAG: hypothetical protein CVV13_08790 [Gammaproteobacteria bacterium HGW-Gammaproteobacteria-3]|nr:MAG: hypothetical protein CVV13_08790 [Gammaproteobacteria bacterium HGW-Gammaproteobacteria-3]